MTRIFTLNSKVKSSSSPGVTNLCNNCDANLSNYVFFSFPQLYVVSQYKILVSLLGKFLTVIQRQLFISIYFFICSFYVIV